MCTLLVPAGRLNTTFVGSPWARRMTSWPDGAGAGAGAGWVGIGEGIGSDTGAGMGAALRAKLALSRPSVRSHFPPLCR